VLSGSPERVRWVARAGGVLVVAVTFIAFLPVLRNDFVAWDDVPNFLKNDHYRGLGWAHLRWMFTGAHMGRYTPLAWLTHAVDYLLWGMNPLGYHLHSLLLHAAGAGVFYLVARRLLGAAVAGGAGAHDGPGPHHGHGLALVLGAALAALLFGVHPLRVESVAWATERQDVLCGLFYLLSALAYLRGVEDGGRIRTPSWALSVALFLLALLSKAAATPLPAALLLLDIYPLRRVAAVGWRRLLIEKIPYVALAAVIAPIAVIAQSHAGALGELGQYGIAARLAMMAHSFMYYPARFLWWANLSPLHALPARIDPLAPRFALAIVGFVAVTGVLVALRRRWPAGLAVWAYSVLLVLPVSGMVQFGVHLMADRFSYLPGLGFALLAGAGLVRVVEMRGTLRGSIVAACLAVAVLVVAGLAAGAWQQSKVWRDTGTLWRHALAVDPGNAQARFFLGGWLNATGRPRESVVEYQRAAALTDRPDFSIASLERAAAVLTNHAVAHAQRGELEAARSLFGEALRVLPGYPDACANLRRLGEMTLVEPEDLRGCAGAGPPSPGRPRAPRPSPPGR
jgi:tetratricopeptide (TPR) repeat protein